MTSTLRISHMERQTELLGPGSRFVIWVHGCCFDCPGCLADNTKNGPYTTYDVPTLAAQIAASGADGLTISGGEPFLQAAGLAALIDRVRAQRDMGVIVYSGFTLEELQADAAAAELLARIDILIDGRYVEQLDDGRAYIGSSNQRLLYLTDRYRGSGPAYYSAPKRRAEIRLTADQAVLIGVPTAETLQVWKRLKEKTGGVVYDF